jgi:CysZ protein
VVLTAILLLLAWIGAGAALENAHFFTTSWLDWGARALAFLSTVGVTLLLFSTIVLTVAGLLLDDVLEAVERRWYPGLPAPRHQSVGEILWTGIGFAVKAVALNLVVLPLYLIPGANIAVFLAVNGWLIGREYFQMVGVRHERPRDARRQLDAARFTAFTTGVLIAAMSYIPLLNLAAPIVGAAAMSHVYHRARLAGQAQPR